LNFGQRKCFPQKIIGDKDSTSCDAMPFQASHCDRTITLEFF
jgi:hypothetical protein